MLVRFNHIAHLVVNANHGVTIRLVQVGPVFQNSAHYENENFTHNKFIEPLACT